MAQNGVKIIFDLNVCNEIKRQLQVTTVPVGAIHWCGERELAIGLSVPGVYRLVVRPIDLAKNVSCFSYGLSFYK